MKSIFIFLLAALPASQLKTCKKPQQVRYEGTKSYWGKGNQWDKRPDRRDVKNVRLY